MHFTTTAVVSRYAFPRNITSPTYTIIHHYSLSVTNVAQTENVFCSQMYRNKHFVIPVQVWENSNAVIGQTLTHYHNTGSITTSVYVFSPSCRGNYISVQTRLIVLPFIIFFTVQQQHFLQQNYIIRTHVHESLYY